MFLEEKSVVKAKTNTFIYIHYTFVYDFPSKQTYKTKSNTFLLQSVL